MFFSNDLHGHSDRSDGDVPPETIIQLASAAGMRGVCLSDHGTTAGSAAYLTAAEEAGLLSLPAVEFTCRYQVYLFDVLAYGFDLADRGVQVLLHQQRAAYARALGRYRDYLVRQQRPCPTLAAVRERFGIPFEVQHGHYFDRYRREVLGVSAETIEADSRAARIRGDNLHALYMQTMPAVEDVLSAVRAAGGCCSLAHSGHSAAHQLSWLRERPLLERVTRWLELVATPLVRLGLAAIELRHPSHPPAVETCLAAWVRRYHPRLGLTGGSDYHGAYPTPGRPRFVWGQYGLTRQEFEVFRKRCLS